VRDWHRGLDQDHGKRGPARVRLLQIRDDVLDARGDGSECRGAKTQTPAASSRNARPDEGAWPPKGDECGQALSGPSTRGTNIGQTRTPWPALLAVLGLASIQ